MNKLYLQWLLGVFFLVVLFLGWRFRLVLFELPHSSLISMAIAIGVLIFAGRYLKRFPTSTKVFRISARLDRLSRIGGIVGGGGVILAFIWAIVATKMAPDTDAGVWIVFGPGLTLLVGGIICVCFRIFVWILREAGSD